MQTYLVRKSKNICFVIFYPCLDNFVWSGEIYFLQKFMQSTEFYWWRILSSLENFIHQDPYLYLFYCRKCYSPQRVLKLSSSVETFFHCRDFYLVYRLYPMYRLLSNVEIFIHCRDFNLVQRILFSVETFIQSRDFYVVWNILSSAETFTQYRDFHPLSRRLSSIFSLTKQPKIAHTETKIQDFKNYNCDQIIVIKHFLNTHIFVPTYVSLVFLKNPGWIH